MRQTLFALLLLGLASSASHATALIKEDTAVTVQLGPFVDAVDGTTVEPGLGGNGGNVETNIKLSKAGATFAARNSTTDPVHDTAGFYRVELNATDTSIPGELVVECSDPTTYLPVWHRFTVVPANVYDSMVAGSDKLEVDTLQFGGANGTFSAGLPDVNATQLSGSSTAADNAEVVFGTDFAANYDATADKWKSSLTHINGSALGSTGAANFRAFFDGNGYGHVICSTTVAGNPTSSDTVMILQTPRPENDGGLVGCIAVLRSTSAGEDFGPAVSVHRIVSYNYDAAVGTITIDSTPSFDLAAGDQVTILEPTFLSGDRTNLAAILADTGTDGVVLANNAITHEKIAADAIGSSEVASGAIVKGTEATGWNDPTADGIANAVLDESLGEHTIPGSLSDVVSDIFNFLDDAPTFSSAMDGQGYTTDLATKLDTNVDAKISEVPAKTPSLLVSSTIDDSSVTVTQTSFALAAGPPDDDALNGAIVIVTRGTQKSVGLVKDYVALTKTVTLLTDPGIFAFADEDQVDVIATGAGVPLWLSTQ